MSKSVDSDQMICSVASDLSLYGLDRPVCHPNRVNVFIFEETKILLSWILTEMFKLCIIYLQLFLSKS